MSKNEKTVEQRLDSIEKLLLLNKPVYTVADAALLSGYEESYVYKLSHLRQIPHYKPRGGGIRFRPEELIEWCLQNKVPTINELSIEADRYILKNKSGKSR